MTFLYKNFGTCYFF